MNAVQLVQRLHQHRNWVDQKLLTAAETLSQEQLRHQFAIGQGSVWQTLLHLYAAEYVWLEALLGNEDPLTPGDVAGKTPGNQQGDQSIQSLVELKSRWDECKRRWQGYLLQLTEPQMDEIIRKRTSSTQKSAATKCGDVLLHVCTHAQYTTAQLINMLRQLGVPNLPDVMLISLARAES